MSLKVWLPLNGDLENKGCSSYSITSIENSPTFTTGKIGQCYQRANSSSQLTNGLRIEDNLVNLLGTTASVSVWVKPLGTHTHYNGTIISSGDWNHSRWAFGVSQDNSQVDVLSGGHNKYITCSVPVNEWTHLVSTFDNGLCKLYKNGEYIGQRTGETAFSSDATWTGIGRESYAGGYFGFNGCINDLRIYNHVLSAAEIKEISQGLILHYKLNQSNPNILPENIFDIDPWKSAIYAHELYQGRLAYRVGNNILYQKTSSGVNDVFAGAINYEANTQYTLSVTWRDDYRTDSKNSSLYLRFNYTDGSTVTNMISPANSVQEWVHQSITSNAGKTISKITTTYGNGGQLYLTDLKLEKGTIDTGVSITNNNVIIDSSGYNNNGQVVDGTFVEDTPRYDNAINLQGTAVDGSSNTLTGAQFFYCNMDMPATDKLTIAWWGKNLAYGRGGIFETSNTVQTDTTKGTDYNTTAIANWDSTFGIYNGSSRVNIFSNFNKDGNWHHHAITFDGTNVKYYCDSELKQTSTLTGTLPAWKSFCMGLGKAGGVWRQIEQYVSDLRIYCTPLLDNDIKSLYNVGMKIDNLSNIHIFELVENDDDNKITKLGTLLGQSFYENGYENILQYDKTIYTEPDGSTWVHVFHHNNPANARFTDGAEDWTNGKYLDTDRWYDIEKMVNNLVKYEFLVKQTTTSSATETKYRWVQDINPLQATWNDVKPGTVTFDTSSGYSSSSYGGMYLMKTSNLHMCIANSSNGNWYGGIGACAIFNNGIPGYPNTTVTSGYVDLYMRVYLPTKIIKDTGVSTIQFIER